MRAAWVQVHLWLGLTLGVLGVFIGITGSILVFDRDIDALLNPQRYRLSGPGPARPISEYVANALAAVGGQGRATLVRLPEGEGMPVVVFARGRAEGGAYRVYLDPPNGRVLDAAPGGGFIGWVHGFHENLSLREYFGREIVGAVGIGMLISSLSGLYLWWPARGRFASSLGFRRGLPATRNLHYFFGFYGFVVLAMLSFTGIFIAYTEAGRAVVAVFAPLSVPARNVQAPGGSRAAKPVSVDGAIRIAKELYPAERVWSVGLPAGPRGTYRVNLSEPGVPAAQAGRGTVVFVDPDSGAILRRVDASTRTGGDNFLVMQRALHSGEPFGVLGRAVICVVGLLPGLFVVTGSLMWLRQRRARRG
jgi:uncharacterized iron-regulated membrane protein